MSYIDESLGRNETLLYRARFHWLYFALAWAVFVALIGLGAWSVLFAEAWTAWLLLAGCLVGLLLLLRNMLPIWTTEIAVTNHRLILKRGWLKRSTDEFQLKAIEQVNFHQGFWGRLFDFGHVDVHGTGMEDLRIPAVASPLPFLRAIEDAASPAKSITVSLPAVGRPPKPGRSP